MDRSASQRKRLSEPLLPPGSNSRIETIVEEDFPEDFSDDLAHYINQDDPPLSAIPPIFSQNLDFNTSNSSTSTGSYVSSSISDNHVSSNSVRIGSSSSLSSHSNKFLTSESSSSYPGSTNHYGYTADSHHDGTHDGLHNTSNLHQNPFYTPEELVSEPSHSTSCVGGSSEFGSTTSEDDTNDPLKDIEPSINLGPHFDMNDYWLENHPVVVEFIDLDNRIFEKQQSRKDKKARQRIVDGKVKISVGSERLVSEIKVWVRREPQAATLCNDKNGEVELKKATLLRHTNNQWLYVVDLDSVYEGKERPVYELAKVEMNERNMFELVVQVFFQTGQCSKKITSKPFLTRTMKRTYQDDVPQSSASSNKRPHTWHSSGVSSSKSPRYSPHPSNAENDVDSSASPGSSSANSTGSTNTANLDKLIVEHLEAQRAHIENLTFGYMQTRRGDIAYHIRLTNQAQGINLTEGVVVGFFPFDGKTRIERLSSQNVHEAVMAGVISRSAYVEAEVPEKEAKGETDAVCVIGMIKVQVQGSVNTGERIYTSSDQDGVAIPESHLPIRSFITKENTMLGMAMEHHTPRKPGDFNLVKCFVCIVLGIGSQQLAHEVESVLESIETNLKVEVKRSSKRTWRRIYCFSALALFLLVATGFLLYQVLFPGTMYRYWRCRIGSIPDHYLMYEFEWDGMKAVQIHGIEFEFNSLNKKLKDTVDKIQIEPFKHTTDGVRFYLNVDRCAYGGETDGGFFEKTVKGGLVLADACPCNETRPIIKFVDGTRWCAYTTKHPVPGSLKCNPKECTAAQRNFSRIYPTYKSLNHTDKGMVCTEREAH